MSSTLRRAWLLTNIAVTVALLPALFPGDGDGRGTAVAAGPGALAPATTAEPTTTSTTAAPTTTTVPPPTTTTTTEAVVVAQVVRTTTTTTSPPPPTTTTVAPAPAPTGSESGRATWYDHEPGICAHKTLPFGTVVTVNAVNGKSVRCTVGDRGPYVDGYVIDLHWQEFEQLAPRSAGRIDVTITW